MLPGKVIFGDTTAQRALNPATRFQVCCHSPQPGSLSCAPRQPQQPPTHTPKAALAGFQSTFSTLQVNGFAALDSSLIPASYPQRPFLAWPAGRSSLYLLLSLWLRRVTRAFLCNRFSNFLKVPQRVKCQLSVSNSHAGSTNSVRRC